MRFKMWKILLIEDNDDHAELIRRVLNEYGLDKQIEHIKDGQAALDYLYEGDEPDEGRRRLPDLILLDLRLPKIDGLEVLRVIKTNPSLKRIPVIVLTTSEAENDIAAAYENHVNSYMVKPIGFDALANSIKEIGRYWLTLNTQPDLAHLTSAIGGNNAAG